MIVVAGGAYLETCRWPKRDDLFGSAGRAAFALKMSGCAARLSTFAPENRENEVEAAFSGFDIPITFSESDHLYEFEYLHPLAVPSIYPLPIEAMKVGNASGDVVLRFGTLEGTFVVDARRAIYDPQSSEELFSANGSKAEDLAVVLNLQELRLLTKLQDEEQAVHELFKLEGASTVVVKNGPFGATVYSQGQTPVRVPPLQTARVTKVGTGDIFSAAFAFWWGNQNNSAPEAAQKSSVCVAAYCQDKCFDFRESILKSFDDAPAPKSSSLIYLAGPFFSAGQFFLIEEILATLEKLGGNVFSPYHDIGLGKPDHVAPLDLAAIDRATAVFAIIDGCDAGTLFEVGYARKRGIPVVALAENPKESDLTMLIGSDCVVTDDISSAVYNAIWSSWR